MPNKDAVELLELTIPEYMALRSAYWDSIHSAVFDYLSGEGNIAGFGNDMRIAVSEGFTDAAHIGWSDGVALGAGKYAREGTLFLDAEATALLNAFIQEEFGHISVLEVRFRSIRTIGFSPETVTAEAQARADGYSRTLDRIYNAFKVKSRGALLLTFTGNDGLESCSDCQRYKGQRHRAWWWVRYDAVPPNRNFECGGYRCEHYLIDDEGNVFTI